MKKWILLAVFPFLFALAGVAGDAASFDDIGFSDDGNYYLFGQYGKADVTYIPWAEIFTVDVAKNAYVPDEVFRSTETSPDVSGRSAYDALKEKAAWKTSKYNAKPATVKTLLYLRDEAKSPTEPIAFKDFEGVLGHEGYSYSVRLVPTFEGSGESCRSKFFIEVKESDANGASVSSFTVGSPDYEREGVTSYRIEKIFSDESGKSLVFIVQKTQEDSTGTSIRYMVETCRMP